MNGIIDNVVCVKCGCVIEFSHEIRTLLGLYMCYRCHAAKKDISEHIRKPLEVIQDIEKTNQCQITDYYVPRNRLRALK